MRLIKIALVMALFAGVMILLFRSGRGWSGLLVIAAAALYAFGTSLLPPRAQRIEEYVTSTLMITLGIGTMGVILGLYLGTHLEIHEIKPLLWAGLAFSILPVTLAVLGFLTLIDSAHKHRDQRSSERTRPDDAR